jgi:secreted PhoX family phosphatase
LTNGKTYVMSINGLKTEAEFRSLVGKGKVTDVQFKAVDTSVNGVEQNKQAALFGTSLARVEDGAFDPNNPRDYYFVTTESNKDKNATALDPNNKLVTKRDGGALWRLRLADAKSPAKGGELTMLLDGSEAPYMNKPDNIEVDGYGNILIEEDPGNNPQVERMFAYRIKDGKIAVMTQFKASMFSKAAASADFITEDEEQSSILNVTSIMRTSKTDTNFYYVLNAQVHATGADLLKSRPDITTDAGKAALLNAIEGGQLYLMTVTNWAAVYGD